MNAVVARQDHSAVSEYVEAVFRGDRGVNLPLPEHVPVQRFKQNLYTAIIRRPDLLKCPPAAVFREVTAVAALGLSFEPALGEAYIFVGKGQQPTARIGYRGIIKLARQSGALHSIYAHEVYRTDRFDVSLGDDKRLIHKPDLLSEDRGEPLFYYAVARFSAAPGDLDFEIMTMKAIHAVRARSDSWKAGAGPWITDDGEMSKKTVIRRLLKRLPQSPELAAALDREETEYSNVVGLPAAPVRRVPPPPPAPAATEPPAPPQGEEAEFREVDHEAVVANFENCVGAASTLDQLGECEADLIDVIGDLPPDLRARVNEASRHARARLEPPETDAAAETEARTKLLEKLRAKAAKGVRPLKIKLSSLSPDERMLITEGDVDTLMEQAEETGL